LAIVAAVAPISRKSDDGSGVGDTADVPVTLNAGIDSPLMLTTRHGPSSRRLATRPVANPGIDNHVTRVGSGPVDNPNQ